MKILKPIPWLVLFLFLYSCTSAPTNKNIFVEKQFENGNPQVIRIYNDTDSLKFIYEELNQQGNIIDSVLYISGKREGLRKAVNEKEGVIYYVNYEKDSSEGVAKAFYQNGTPYYYGINKKGKQFLEWKFYHSNGKLASYEFFNSYGERTFLRKYDSNGKLLKKMGNPLIEVHMQKNKIKLSDSLDGYFLLAQPPNSKMKLLVGTSDEPESKYKPAKFDVLRADFSVKFNKVGNQQIKFSWELQENDVKENIKGNQWIDITVIPD